MTYQAVFVRPALLVLVAAVGALLPAAAAPPRTPEPVADLQTGFSNPASDPHSLLRVGGWIYFAARDPLRGETLWRSDGTAQGTEPVTDLCPGPCDASIGELTAVGDRLFFIAFEEPHSFRHTFYWKTTLWTSDGTAEGTLPLARSLGPNPHQFSDFVPFHGSLYFAAQTPFGTTELWTSDGTRTGTAPTGLCPTDCRPLVALGDQLLLHVFHSAEDQELWATDGTAEGTRLLADVWPDPSRPGPTVIGDRAFFNGFDVEHGSEPWVTDGTPAGTLPLGDLVPGPLSGGFRYAFSLGGAVYLLAAPFVEPGPPVFWRTDGTPEGTVPANELLDAGRAVRLDTAAPPVAGRFLYLTTYAAGADLATLWRFDVTTGETRQVRDGVDPAPDFASLGAPLGTGLVFMNWSAGVGVEPWFTDGTPEGTRLLRDVHPGLGWSDGLEATPFEGRVVFVAEDAPFHRELWVTDGTPAGTDFLVDLSAGRTDSDPRHLTVYDDRLYFRAEASPPGLYALDGPDDTPVLFDERLGLAPLVPIGRDLYTTDAFGRPMVLRPDLPAAILLADTQRARHFTAGPDGRAYFATSGTGEELWSTDGTPEGTRLVIDLDPDWIDPCFEFFPDCPPPERDEPSYPSSLTPAGDRLVFVAVPKGIFAPALWSTDGTAAGTVRISPEDAGPVWETAPLRGGVVFLVRRSGGGHALWWSDGTAAGTRRLVVFGTGRTPDRLSVTGGTAFFLVEHIANEADPLTLWRTDGTSAGTRPVAPLGTATLLADADEIVAAEGRAFVSVHSDAVGDELWVSDGTAAGTRLVRDLWPGPRGSNPSHLTPVGRFLLFAADDGESGHEPWITDGTAAGTVRVGDLHEGPAPSSPSGFTAFDGRVYFSADDGRIDRELWSFPLAEGGGGEVPPPPADATEIAALELGGFRLWVRISSGGTVLPVRREPCIPETVCVSGAVPGRPELFVRIVGPKPNGMLWPTLVRFSTSTLDVWIEQVSTGILRHYRLDGATPGSSALDGLFDRNGFPPE